MPCAKPLKRYGYTVDKFEITICWQLIHKLYKVHPVTCPQVVSLRNRLA